MATNIEMGTLLRRQWTGYSGVHSDRVNLAVHLATVPLFMAGTILLVATPLVGWIGFLGLATMAAAIGAQGRTHGREPTPPPPFHGPVDVVTRLLAEQWLTFPRFVLSGGFARAWRAAGQGSDGLRRA